MNPSETRLVTANYVSITPTYFEDVFVPAFTRATAHGDAMEKTYVIAGKRMRLLFHSPVLGENMTRAFSHLESFDGGADITVHIFDSATDGTHFSSPWARPEYMFRQEAGQREVASNGLLGVYLHGEETLTIYDREHATAYFWTNDARELAPWVCASPLRTLLAWFLAPSGVSLIHGAVVGKHNKSALITAKGGSGKSTTALRCLTAGMDYLADDYVGIELGTPPIAHSLYCSAKLVPTHKDPLLPEAWNREGEKAIMFLSEKFSKNIALSAPLRAIFIPVLTHGSQTLIVPASKSRALLALAPTTLFQLPLMGSGTLETLRNLVDVTPCYFLKLGTDSAEIAETIEKTLHAIS